LTIIIFESLQLRGSCLCHPTCKGFVGQQQSIKPAVNTPVFQTISMDAKTLMLHVHDVVIFNDFAMSLPVLPAAILTSMRYVQNGLFSPMQLVCGASHAVQ
jgi:hypothetical protein